MKKFNYLGPIFLSLALVSCSSSKNDVVIPEPVSDTATPVTKKSVEEPISGAKAVVVNSSIPVLTLEFTATKVFHFTWLTVPGATSYKLKEDITSTSGYEIINTATATDTSFDHVVPLYARLNAKYILESCIKDDCTKMSAEVFTMPSVMTDMASSIGYFKASNTGKGDNFGNSMSLSEDGNTLAVSAFAEDSNSIVKDMGQDNNLAPDAGAVYVFFRSDDVWSQQAYLKASNAGRDDTFGNSVSLSADGNTLAVGARFEDGDAGGNNAARLSNSGAAYVFIRRDVEWSEQTRLKAGVPSLNAYFGTSVSLSEDGDILAVGASGDNNASGAVYVFTRTDITWSPPTPLTASNSGDNDSFGFSLSLSADGSTLAVGAVGESSSSREIDMGQDNNTASASNSGAVYVFAYSETGIPWSQEIYLKAGNSGGDDQFGRSVSISADGNTLAVGAVAEGSAATGVNHALLDGGADGSGAAYVFTRTVENGDVMWEQQAYIKASNTDRSDQFGRSVTISANGNTLSVGAPSESSDTVGIGGAQGNGASTSGAVYTFTRSGTTWTQQAYIKARNTGADDSFGATVALSADGGTLVVGADGEDSPAMGVNPDETGNEETSANSGAVYVY